MSLSLADGQLASSAAVILDVAASGRTVNLVFTNTSGSASETVLVTVSRAGGTGRRLTRAVIAANESLYVNGVALDPGDNISASATDATTVDYQVTVGSGPFNVYSLDVNGAMKQVNSGISGNQSVGGTITSTTGAVTAGQSGTAGTLKAFAGTAAKGALTLTTSDNSGNTTTNVNAAAQGGARTYTIPDAGASADFMLSAQTQGADGLFATPVSLTHFKNTDGSTLAASAAAGKFGLSITLGTSMFMVGEAAQGNTKTDDAIIEYTLPPWYVAAQNLTVKVYAKLTGAGTAGTKTAQVLAYRTATDGTQGADIGPGTTSAITAAGADISATITGTTLNPGDKVVFKLEVVLQETGGASTLTAQVGSFRVT